MKIRTILILISVFSTYSISAAVIYSVTDLTQNFGSNESYATSISDLGQVSGYISPSQSFVFQNGIVNLIDPPGGKVAFGINVNGQLTGTLSVGGISHAFFYKNGITTDLGTLGGLQSWGYGINKSGQITGWANIASGHHRAFVYSNGVMTNLGVLPGGSNSWGLAINNYGQVTGWSDTNINGGGFHPFVTVNGVMTDLKVQGQGWAINLSGQVAGHMIANGDKRHAFVTQGNLIKDIGTLGVSSEARGINNSGQVVGFFDNPYTGSNRDRRAFVTRNGIMADLNTLIDPNSGWHLNTATDINNSGQIIGYGINPAGNTHAFLLKKVKITN